MKRRENGCWASSDAEGGVARQPLPVPRSGAGLGLPWARWPALLLATALLAPSASRSQPTYEAISREVSVFGLSQPSAPLEAISHEVSVFGLSQPSAPLETISREVSVFGLSQPSAPLEAISREVSVLNDLNPAWVSLGGGLLLQGASGVLPVNLRTARPLTNLELTVVAPPGLLTGVSLEPIIPQICSGTVTPLAGGLLRLELGACPSQWLSGTQQIAWLQFTVASNQPSAFVWPALTGLQGTDNQGYGVAVFGQQPGRLVVVGQEPLLDCVFGTNQQPTLVLYGIPAATYALDWRADLAGGAWQTVLTGLSLTNISQPIQPPPSSSPANFYRAAKLSGGP